MLRSGDERSALGCRVELCADRGAGVGAVAWVVADRTAQRPLRLAAPTAVREADRAGVQPSRRERRENEWALNDDSCASGDGSGGEDA